jgi:GGDEF domain-containing protein
VYNRRHFFDVAQKEFERARRYGGSLRWSSSTWTTSSRSTITTGTRGDAVLRAVSDLVQPKPNPDTFARYGGEEFVFLLPDTGAGRQPAFTERLRELAAQTPSHTMATPCSSPLAPASVRACQKTRRSTH